MHAFPKHIIVLGRFPPPPDGQSVATHRLADYLSTRCSVHRVDTMIPADARRGAKLRHYRGVGRALGNVLEAYPEAPIIWTSISPEPTGHWRDVLTLFPRLEGRTVIAVAHWGKFATVFDHASSRWTARRLIPGLDRLVFTAPELSDACAAWVPDTRRAVVPNTLDEALIPSGDTVSNRIEKGPGAPLRVLFLSNMIREKGWEDVLEAARLLNEGSRTYSWVFVGGWPNPTEMPLFEKKVQQLGIGDNVEFKGLLSERDGIAREHLAADLFVLPSWLREAQPLSIMEAMAAGTPCVVADDGGMPGMIGAGSGSPAGRVVAARRPDQLAEAVSSLSDPTQWKNHALAARALFDARFAPAVVNRQWNALIEDVHSSGGSA